LQPIFKKGKLIYKLPAIDGIRKHLTDEIEKLPNQLKDINRGHSYPVKLSPGLKNLMAGLKIKK